MVSYAVGAMLGAVFLEILPHAFKLTTHIETTTFVVLFGILLFFVLEKLLLWRHCHGDHCEVHDVQHEDHTSKSHQHAHDEGRSGSMIMVVELFEYDAVVAYEVDMAWLTYEAVCANVT